MRFVPSDPPRVVNLVSRKTAADAACNTNETNRPALDIADQSRDSAARADRQSVAFLGCRPQPVAASGTDHPRPTRGVRHTGGPCGPGM